MPVIPEMSEKSLLTISSLSLTLGVHAADNFWVAIVESFESRFIANNDLSDIDHIRHHARAVIELDKEFDFSPGFHRLDTLSHLAIASEEINEIACYYPYLPLKRVDTFYQKCID